MLAHRPRRAIKVARLIPTGECWCGCGEETGLGSFFRPGHDKKAESYVIALDFGTVADFLDARGYGPGGKNPRVEFERKQGAS
jgi:hypothetical protein